MAAEEGVDAENAPQCTCWAPVKPVCSEGGCEAVHDACLASPRACGRWVGEPWIPAPLPT